MEKPTPLPIKLMILVSLIQGLCLLYLHQAIELKYWPHQQPQWLFAFYSMAFIWPTMLLLGLNGGNGRRLFSITAPYAILSGLLGFYIGYQATPIEYIRYDVLLFGFITTMAIATFKVLMYSQQFSTDRKITYSSLFLWSWRNFLTLGLALLFAGSFWLILVLWGELFEAIGIDFFQDLFEKRWFYYPAVALANGFGVIIFRNQTGIIDTITRLQQALMKFLLVVLALVSLLFLGALPFTGLPPLWDGGGSALILGMQALILFFINAVYQDEPEICPYSIWLHRFIYIAVAVLPIYSIISFYGLSLRVDQYGWSLSRYWAFFIWFLLALFPLGYWWGIAKLRDGWIHQLSKVNVVMGLVVLAATLLVNSPLLDFRKMAAYSQLDRLKNNAITVDDIDIQYFRYDLARPGYNVLQMLKTEYGADNPSLVVRINALYADRNGESPSSTREQFVAAVTLLSESPPVALLDTIYQDTMERPWAIRGVDNYYLESLNVDADEGLEYLWVKRSGDSSSITLYYLDGSEWLSLQVGNFWKSNSDANIFYDALKKGDITTIEPRWNDIIIGDQRFSIGTDND